MVDVFTLAGSTQGLLDGNGTSAQFNRPNGITKDKDGNIYVVDAGSNTVRMIKPDGQVLTLAGGDKGYLDGVGAAARFNSPYGIAVDEDLNVYVADTFNHCIRKIQPNGSVTTLAGRTSPGSRDGVAEVAQFNLPFSLDVDELGNIYVADTANHKIRKITPLGLVTTIAGTGVPGYVEGAALQAQFSVPNDVTVTQDQDVYIADFGNHSIRKLTYGGYVSTLAGGRSSGLSDGVGPAAEFSAPTGVAVDNNGNIIVADNDNHRICRVTAEGLVMTIAGVGSPGLRNGDGDYAMFSSPTDLVVDSQNRIVVCDTDNHVIRAIIARATP